MPQFSDRPSKREICKKVADALEALQAGRCLVGIGEHLVDDLAALQIEDENALWKLLLELLREIQDVDPNKCYAGCRPPQKSYEEETYGEELWAYAWQSRELNMKVYLKFVMRQNVKGEWIYAHARIHESKKKK